MEPKLSKANYTKLYKDISQASKDAIDAIFLQHFSFSIPLSLYTVFESMWRFYEICDADEEVFVKCIHDVYNEHCNYYRELYINYTKEYDYMLGNKRTMERHDAAHSEHSSDNADSGTGSKTGYDLPNKVVNPTTADGYATEKTVDTAQNEAHETGERDSTYDSTVTHTYDNEILDLKKKYLEQIRNIYREFSSKFSDCFLHLFS